MILQVVLQVDRSLRELSFNFPTGAPMPGVESVGSIFKRLLQHWLPQPTITTMDGLKDSRLGEATNWIIDWAIN